MFIITLLVGCSVIPITCDSVTPNILQIKGSDTFDEDFTTTTYEAGTTTAWGWGTGAVTSERNFAATQMDFFPTSYAVSNIEIQGHKAFITTLNDVDATDNLKILDLTDPGDMREIASRDSLAYPYALGVSGDLFVTGLGNDPQDLYVFNITAPSDFDNEVVDVMTDNSIDLDGYIYDIEIDGPFIYCAVFSSDAQEGIVVINASAPEDLAVYDSTINNWVSHQTYGLDVSGNLLFVTESNGDLTVLNITDREGFGTVGSVDTTDTAYDVLVDGQYAYVANGYSGVKVVSLETLSSPTILGTYNTPGVAYKLAKQGNTLFVADQEGGVIVLDVVNPEQPVFLTQLSLSTVYDVALYGGDLFVASSAGVYS